MTNTSSSRRVWIAVGVVAGVAVAIVAWRATSSASSASSAASASSEAPASSVVDVVIDHCRSYRQAQDVRKLLESLVGEAQVQQVSVREGEGLLRVTGEPGHALAARLRGQRIRDEAVVVGDVTDATVHLTVEGA